MEDKHYNPAKNENAISIIRQGFIPLTQGQYAVVDSDVYETLSKHKWCASYIEQTKSYRAVRRKKDANGKSRIVFMHREIMGAPKGMVVDHINHDTLDNRKQNLRVCTKAENNRNLSVQKNRSSAYKGVAKSSLKSKGWRACISFSGKYLHLGYFHTEKEAAIAYNEKAKELYKSFALLNTI